MENYEALVAEEKQHNAVMQKKIFQFMANLQQQASKGKFEESKLEEPVQIVEKDRPSAEEAMKKKEAKIESLQAQVAEVNEEAYKELVAAHQETKAKEEKHKEQLKRENLQELAGFKLADPQKLEDLESQVRKIPITDPKRVTALEQQVKNIPIIDPNKLIELEGFIKRVESDAKARSEQMSNSFQAEQSARRQAGEKGAEQRQMELQKALNDRINELKYQLEDVTQKHQDHVKGQTVKNMQLETQVMGIGKAQESDAETKVSHDALNPLFEKISTMEATLAEIKSELNLKTMQLEQDG